MDGVKDDADDLYPTSHHTVILGWSPKIPSLLRQLAVANQSIGGGVITVLAALELASMQQEFALYNIDMLGTTVKFHCGSRHDTKTLHHVAIDTASAIIVLAEDADESDELAILIIKKILKVVAANFQGHVVVEVIDVENESRIKEAGGEFVETVVAKDVITRLMVQCARQPGLAQVSKDILGFDKAEFYLKRWPKLDGMRFIDVLISFPDAIPCGVKVASRNNKIVINPDNEYVLADGDEVLVIADDDDSYSPSPSLPEVQKSAREAKENVDGKVVKKMLFCGWQRDMEDMVPVLEESLGVGSELWMFSEMPEEKRLTQQKGELENLTLVHCLGKPSSRKDLEALPLETFDSILLVADGNAPVEEALSTLIMIKGIQAKRLPYREARAVQIRPAGNSRSSWIDELQHSSSQTIIVSEILSSHTKEALEDEDHGEIAVSDEMVSMALAMVAEDRRIGGVLDELFAEEGNEMMMRPSEMYLDVDGEELSFWDVVVRARGRNEIVIGYHREDEEMPVINPGEKGVRYKWSLDDSFVVLVAALT